MIWKRQYRQLALESTSSSAQRIIFKTIIVNRLSINVNFETRIRFATKIVKNQRVYFVFALNEMQQAAFERAKQNEMLRTQCG